MTHMNITIRKLTPSLVDDYTHFFETTSHYGSDDTKCYCVTWCGDTVYQNGGSHWYSCPDERKRHAVQRVRDGEIQGYLAYCDGRVAGWCNANTKSDCQLGMNHLRSDGGVPIEECREGEKIKFIFCFAIAPNVRRKGVATKLLEYVCQDAAADGFDFAEAFVYKEFSDASRDFRGSLAMYEKCGFNAHAERDGKIVVRKMLNQR